MVVKSQEATYKEWNSPTAHSETPVNISSILEPLPLSNHNQEAKETTTVYREHQTQGHVTSHLADPRPQCSHSESSLENILTHGVGDISVRGGAIW